MGYLVRFSASPPTPPAESIRDWTTGFSVPCIGEWLQPFWRFAHFEKLELAREGEDTEAEASSRLVEDERMSGSFFQTILIILPRAKAIDGWQRDSTEVELASARPETGLVAFIKPKPSKFWGRKRGGNLGTREESIYGVGSINSWPVPRTPAPSTHRFEFEDVTSPISGPGDPREIIHVGTRDWFGHSWGTWAAPQPL